MTQTQPAKARAPRIRLGMVGGGQGAFIGAVHRIAARIDGEFELVAGALSSDPARANRGIRSSRQALQAKRSINPFPLCGVKARIAPAPTSISLPSIALPASLRAAPYP